MRHLIEQIKQEIADTERSLTFWQEQRKLQAGTPLADRAQRLAAGYEVQLEQLHEARKLFDA